MTVEPLGTVRVTVRVNGQEHTADVEARLLLVHFIRENLDLTGTHIGCDTSNCGACTVVLDGRTVKSCSILAADVDGREVLTIESLSSGAEDLHPLQQAFVANQGLQCGFCTPGMVMSLKALVDHSPRPTDDEIKRAVSGNVCRCGTYPRIFEAARMATRTEKGK